VDATWWVRLRQIASGLRFWTAMVGYDPRDRSPSHRIYLIYLLIFFSLWGFSLLVLLAEAGVGLIVLIGPSAPSRTALWMTSTILLGGWMLACWRYVRCSPFIFSAEDSVLICQTPVDRRHVALAWMWGDWLPAVVPSLALVVVLRFASLQLVEQEPIRWSHLPAYWGAGFQAATVVVFLHLALTAGAYTLGALRLRGGRDMPVLRLIPPVFALLLIAIAVLDTGRLQAVLWPVFYPLAAAFGEINWMIGLTVAVSMAAAGVLALYLSSSTMSLSRAAQETQTVSGFQLIRWLGDTSLTSRMKQRERLGAGHITSRIPGKAGTWALLWKNVVIFTRSFDASQLLAWSGIFSACLGLVITDTWGVRMWAFIFWTVLISQRCTAGLRSDLELWPLSRQLPFRGRQLMVGVLALPVVLAIGMTWIALGVSNWLGFPAPGLFAWMVPGLVLNIAILSVLDILRQSKTSDLLAGQVADTQAGGMLLLILLTIFPVYLIWWLSAGGATLGNGWLVVVPVILLSYGLPNMAWRLSDRLYKGIR
jgi:hypothetical protein